MKPDSNEPWIPLVILFALISLLLAFLLGVLVVKKQLLHVCSRRRAGQETREVDEDQTDREGVDPATSNTYFHDAGTQVNNANDASSELIQQSPSVTPSRSCADSEDVPLMVRIPKSDKSKFLVRDRFAYIRRPWSKVFVTSGICTFNKGLINENEGNMLGSNFVT